MQQTTAMILAERQYGKTLRNLIIDLYDEHRNLERVADYLHISRATLVTWRVKLGLEEIELRDIMRQRDAGREVTP